MTMLVKGGFIHTLTDKGSFKGDILVRCGKIEAVESHIDLPEEGNACVLDANGLTILPGLIDAHIRAGAEGVEGILQGADAFGVTAALLWPDEEGPCRLLTPDGITDSAVHALSLLRNTDAQLHDRFLALAGNGLRPACEIHSAEECRRVLQTVHSTRVKAILVYLMDCEELLEAVSLSGCPALLGVIRYSRMSPWTTACRLDALGVPVSLTSSSPSSKLRHLPLCAALCVREGMDRERALRAVTAAPGALLGLSEAGRIAPGCRADFVLYDGDPMLLATSHVMTVAGGKIRH